MSKVTQHFHNQQVNFERNIAVMTDDIGEKLRKLRVLNGFSQEYVAEKIDVSLSSYQRYENDKTGIDFSLMVRISELYKMSLDELYRYGDEDVSKAFDSVAEYLKSQKRVDIMVQLDGSKPTLEGWIKKLSAINEVL